jgi:hydrophobe/amphiphile efflux-3 (HAE3) family protein
MNSAALARWVVRYRWAIVVLFTLVTAVFVPPLRQIQLDTEMKNQLPPDLPTRQHLAEIEKTFGGTDMAMIVLETDDVLKTSTLERLKELSARFSKIPEFDGVLTLFTAKDLRGDMGEMIVEKAVEKMPKDDEQREKLRERLKQNPLVYKNLVSDNFRHSVLIGFLKPNSSDQEIVEKLRKLIEEVPGPEEAFVGGMPVTRVSLTQDMRRDMRTFLPIGLAIMVVFLLVSFRQVRGVVLPFVMTVMAIIVSMGIIPLLGWKVHTVTILLPVILLAVANDYGIHLLARYQEDNTAESTLDSHGLARSGVVELTRPVLATGITTVFGMLCLLSHMIIPAKQLGVLAAVGVAFAMVGSIVFIPALLAILPKAKPIAGKAKAADGPLERLLAVTARWVSRSPKSILAGSVVVCVAMGIGTALIVVDTNPMSFYQKSEPIWRSTNVLNQHLGGWAGVSVLAEGDIKDPKVLQRIDDLEQHLKKHPSVGGTSSIAGVMRKMNQVMNEGDPAFDKVPESRELVAQYLLLYSMSGSEDDFKKLVDFEYKHAQVIAKVTDSGTKAATEVIDYTKAYLAKDPGGPFKMVGGFLDVMADMVHHIVWGQVVSMLLAAVAVALLVSLLLRSLYAGALSVFPLLLALMMVFGVMGLTGIELNLVTALLSSIMIGVGVDYSIHFLWRYRDERAAGLDPVGAVERTLTTTGRGIVINGLSVVVGFAILVVSAFSPVRFFGVLVAISIGASLIGALVVLPALVLLLRPKFLEPNATAG